MGGELQALLVELILGQPGGGGAGATGEAAKPAGEAANPAGEAANPAGEAANPAGEAANPAGEAANPAGEAANPAGEAANPAGEAANPAGEAVNAAGEAANAGADSAADASTAADAAVDAATKAARAVGEAAADVAEVAGPAAPWVEYLVYGSIAFLIVFFVLRGLRGSSTAGLPRDVPRPLIPEAAKPAAPAADETGSADAPAAEKAAEPKKAPEPKAAPAPKKAPAKEPAAAKAREGTPAAPKGDAPPRKAAAERAGKTLREGLARTNQGFVKKLGQLFGGAKTIDDDLLGDLEEALFTADIGVRTSQKLVDLVHDSLGKRDLDRPEKVWGALKEHIRTILRVDAKPLDLASATPFVIMVVGVNGAGKTTTIGKLARRYTDEGRKVMLAAGDTFRAAAVEQLEAWGDRAGVPVVRGADFQDPSSVIFDAISKATEGGYDVLIADTAGRLQAKKELMDELAKVHRVCGKASDGAPHEVWLVLDSTNGQNAISQAKVFTDAVDVTGLVLTKLDGTAKGGVVIGISDEMKLPVRYIGIGEKAEDLRPFDPETFAEALFADD